MSVIICESLLLGQDEGDAVRLQRRSSASSPAVEHGQRGPRWKNAALCGHVPQLIGVPVNSVVVVQLDSAEHTAAHVTRQAV